MVALTVAQLAELWSASAHGELAEVWFDGGWTGMKDNISALLATAQPNTVAFNGCVPPNGCIGTAGGGNTRWVGTESGSVDRSLVGTAQQPRCSRGTRARGRAGVRNREPAGHRP